MARDVDPGLLLRRIGSTEPWDSPEMTAYENEDHLQRIIATDPQYVPGVPEGAVTVRELSTAAGPADVCIVSPDGTITIVECKLASNSERRRMVIGQVLDYASAIWVDGAKSFREQWNRQRGNDLAALGETALEQLDLNITEGRIDLCLAVDRIDNDLKRLVEFLNRITRDEVAVTALQLTYARHGDIEFLMPSTYAAKSPPLKPAVLAPRHPGPHNHSWTHSAPRPTASPPSGSSNFSKTSMTSADHMRPCGSAIVREAASSCTPMDSGTHPSNCGSTKPADSWPTEPGTNTSLYDSTRVTPN
ncbi:hypothetical protein [Rhodococcus sp. 24CO]|uniref:hypothetical protein n=1 Tax=Rhodococcus sp. 24CO TaxID=3117460 RepID=UPI003D34AFD5